MSSDSQAALHYSCPGPGLLPPTVPAESAHSRDSSQANNMLINCLICDFGVFEESKGFEAGSASFFFLPLASESFDYWAEPELQLTLHSVFVVSHCAWDNKLSAVM